MKKLRIQQDFEEYEAVLKQICDLSKKLNRSLNEEDVESSFFLKTISHLEQKTEKLAAISRIFPFSLPDRKILLQTLENSIVQENKVFIEYTPEHWFHAIIPNLLPKKENNKVHGSAEYIRTTFLVAMQKFFTQHKAIPYFKKNVLIIQNDYSKNRRDYGYRDHDNIEVNAVSDIVMIFCAKDDAGSLCNHFYCSATDENDQTEIFLMPEEDFACWYKKYLFRTHKENEVGYS